MASKDNMNPKEEVEEVTKYSPLSMKTLPERSLLKQLMKMIMVQKKQSRDFYVNLSTGLPGRIDWKSRKI